MKGKTSEELRERNAQLVIAIVDDVKSINFLDDNGEPSPVVLCRKLAELACVWDMELQSNIFKDMFSMMCMLMHDDGCKGMKFYDDEIVPYYDENEAV